MINIIDRYISRLFLTFFMAGLLVFVSLFVAINFMSEMARYEASTSALIKYYMYDLPSVFYMLLPMAGLVSTVFTLGTLNRHNELVALYSAGMSLFRISLPILTLITVISVSAFFLGDRLLPKFNQMRNYVKYVEILHDPGEVTYVRSDRIWYRSKNVLFNIKTIQAEKSRAQGITLYYFNDDWDLIQMITADAAQIKGHLWDLENGTVTLYAHDQSSPLTQVFAHKTITMEEVIGDLQQPDNTDKVMSIKDLREYIRKNKEAGLDTLHYEVALQSKFGFAFAAFVMSFLGIPFSVSRQRSGGNFASVGVCALLAFIYWIFYSSALILGEHGLIPPELCAWLPNLTMLFLSLIFLVRLKR